MKTDNQATNDESTAARDAFVRYVARHHGIDPDQATIVEQPELHTPPFYAFVAVQGQTIDRIIVEGVSDGKRVFSAHSQHAFEGYLRASDFHAVGHANVVQFMHIYRSLQGRDPNPYAEDAFPLLYAQQLATALRRGLKEMVTLPEVLVEGDEKVVRVWWQLEPGAQFELWTFRVRPDNSYTIEKRLGER